MNSPYQSLLSVLLAWWHPGRLIGWVPATGTFWQMSEGLVCLLLHDVRCQPLLKQLRPCYRYPNCVVKLFKIGQYCVQFNVLLSLWRAMEDIFTRTHFSSFFIFFAERTTWCKTTETFQRAWTRFLDKNILPRWTGNRYLHDDNTVIEEQPKTSITVNWLNLTY